MTDTEKLLVSALRAAWQELSTIKARDGVAYHREYPYRGGTPYCTEYWWDELIQKCRDAIEEATGAPPNPWPFPWEVHDGQDSA